MPRSRGDSTGARCMLSENRVDDVPPGARVHITLGAAVGDTAVVIGVGASPHPPNPPLPAGCSA